MADEDGDGGCDPFEVAGYKDATACNYNEFATDAADCVYPDGICDTCSGEADGTGTVVDNDADDDGICDADEGGRMSGYNSLQLRLEATDDGMCEFAENYYDCDENCLNDADGDGVCDEFEVAGCTDEMACNYNLDATDDDGTCFQNVRGCDAKPATMTVLFSRWHLRLIVACGRLPSAFGNCLNALLEDGSCNYTSCVGCTDQMACNYNFDFHCGQWFMRLQLPGMHGRNSL